MINAVNMQGKYLLSIFTAHIYKKKPSAETTTDGYI